MTVENQYHQGLALGLLKPVKRKIFVSYHHAGDQFYYDQFSNLFHDQYQMIFDNSLERKIDSVDVDYVMRQIRENYVSGSSCTVVLVGQNSWGRKFIDWEISATLEKQHGLIGLQLPTLPIVNGLAIVPDRLNDNITAGYALWKRWDYLVANPSFLAPWIEEANLKNKTLIENSRDRRLRNA